MPRSYTLVPLLAKTRHGFRPSVPGCAAGPAVPPALRRVLCPGCHPLRSVCERPATARCAALRPLRCAHRVARPALPRVLGQADGLRHRARCRRVRGGRPAPRLRLEGAWPTRRRVARRRRDHRRRSAAVRSNDHVRPARRRPQPQARSSPAGMARPRAGTPLGAAGAASPGAQATAQAPARTRSGRASPERPRRLPRFGRVGRACDPRRRRVHDWCDRLGGRECAAKRGGRFG